VNDDCLLSKGAKGMALSLVDMQRAEKHSSFPN